MEALTYGNLNLKRKFGDLIIQLKKRIISLLVCLKYQSRTDIGILITRKLWGIVQEVARNNKKKIWKHASQKDIRFIYIYCASENIIYYLIWLLSCLYCSSQLVIIMEPVHYDYKLGQSCTLPYFTTISVAKSLSKPIVCYERCCRKQEITFNKSVI